MSTNRITLNTDRSTVMAKFDFDEKSRTLVCAEKNILYENNSNTGFMEALEETKRLFLLNVTVIPGSFFSYFEHLEYLYIPEVEAISFGGFEGCANLRTIIAPKLKCLYTRGFWGCGLETACFPSLELIGYRAFGGCSDLKCIIIPKIKIIDEHAFNGCNNLDLVVTQKDLGNISIDRNAFSYCDKYRFK